MSKKKKEIDILSNEDIKYTIESKSKLLNGQLRGNFNPKAREENLGLIMVIMGEIFTDAFQEGLKQGYLARLKEE